MAAAKLGDRKGALGVISCGWTSNAMSAPLRRFDANFSGNNFTTQASRSRGGIFIGLDLVFLCGIRKRSGNTGVDLALSFGADFAACNFGTGHCDLLAPITMRSKIDFSFSKKRVEFRNSKLNFENQGQALLRMSR